MPLKFMPNCKVCQVIHEGDNDLLKRIYGSSRFRIGGESLRQIWLDYKDKFLYSSIAAHAKRHQAISERDLTKRTLQKLHEDAANRSVLALIKHGNVRELVMDKGYKGIKSGKIKLKASDVIKAARDQADIELKQKDQQFEMAKMMEKFMSGELSAAAEDDDNFIEGEITTHGVT